MSNTYYLAIDPGETSGWASFTRDGTPITFNQIKGREPVYNLLKEQQPQCLIVEDFSIFPWKSGDLPFNDLETVRLIGSIEFWAYQQHVPLTLQAPNIKDIGYKWSGTAKAKNHAMSHKLDAYVHGIYYLVKNNILTHTRLRQL